MEEADMLSDSKILLVSLEGNMMQMLCLKTGDRKNIENYFDKITDKIIV